jgi:flagellar basal-body rod protein FlgB
MLANLFDNTTIPVLQEVISFAQARHNVLAGNIANVDTPGYRVRDLSVETFQKRLGEMIDARNYHRKEVASPGHVKASDPGDEMRQVRDSLKTVQFLDGSDVGIEQQVVQVSKNQFLHNLSVSIMNKQFQLLKSAISERV